MSSPRAIGAYAVFRPRDGKSAQVSNTIERAALASTMVLIIALTISAWPTRLGNVGIAGYRYGSPPIGGAIAMTMIESYLAIGPVIAIWQLGRETFAVGEWLIANALLCIYWTVTFGLSIVYNWHANQVIGGFLMTISWLLLTYCLYKYSPVSIGLGTTFNMKDLPDQGAGYRAVSISSPTAEPYTDVERGTVPNIAEDGDTAPESTALLSVNDHNGETDAEGAPPKYSSTRVSKESNEYHFDQQTSEMGERTPSHAVVSFGKA